METAKRNRTTREIYRALFTLLETRPFDTISVNDICQESLISRTTFYSYFEDKFSLVEFCFEEERRNMGIVRGVDVRNNLLTFLKRIKENQTIYKHLLISHANTELTTMIATNFEETIDNVLKETHVGEDRYLTCLFYTGGIAYTIVQWIRADCEIEEEVVVETIWNILDLF